MKARRHISLILVLLLLAPLPATSSAYNARPKLIVVITIDQFRGDYLERWRDEFSPGGFRLFLDRGAVFTECYFDYPATFTAPGHATLFTGTNPSGHGIFSNDWYDPQLKKMVSSVLDNDRKLIGLPGAVATPSMTNAAATTGTVGASPRNLLATTIGDELKLATSGRSHVIAISLKDRSAVLPGGYSADGAYWIDPRSGAFITSSFYMQQLPPWAAEFNGAKHTEQYWDKDWTDANGRVLRHVGRTDAQGKAVNFYDATGPTPFSSEYEFAFARAAIAGAKLGQSETTDLLSLSISGFDFIGHQAGPDSPELHAYALALDRQLADFFGYLGQQFGLANVWIVLAGDHGVAPVTKVAQGLRIPAPVLEPPQVATKVNAALAKRFNAAPNTQFVHDLEWPAVPIFSEPFAAAKVDEAEAERIVGEELKQQIGIKAYYTKHQLESGAVPNDPMGRRFRNGYSPHGGWWLYAQVPPYTLPGGTLGTTHGSPYSYDGHVPLAFVGLPFRPGTYRGESHPTDLAVTLASLLGINKPSHASGRVLTEMLAAPSTGVQ